MTELQAKTLFMITAKTFYLNFHITITISKQKMALNCYK